MRAFFIYGSGLRQGYVSTHWQCQHWFCSLAEARLRIEAWRGDYNEQ